MNKLFWQTSFIYDPYKVFQTDVQEQPKKHQMYKNKPAVIHTNV